MKLLFVASEATAIFQDGRAFGLDVVEAYCRRRWWRWGTEAMPFFCRATGEIRSPDAFASERNGRACGNNLRFPSIAEGKLRSGGVRYFFADDARSFDREKLYGDKTGDYPDNAERFAEFSRTAIEFAKRVLLPDVIHCHDWQTALVPVILRTQHAEDPAVRSLPVVFTIHKHRLSGVFPAATLAKIGLLDKLFSMDALERYGRANFLKGGLAVCRSFDYGVCRRYAEVRIRRPNMARAWRV